MQDSIHTNAVSIPTIPQKVPYPDNLKSYAKKKAFKDKYMEASPNTLFADFDGSGSKTDLIFWTKYPLAWCEASMEHFPSATKTGNKVSRTLVWGTEGNKATGHFYLTGTVMVQGDTASFERGFDTIGRRAAELSEEERERVPGVFLANTPQTPPAETTTHQPHLEPDWLKEIKDEVRDLKDKFSKMEVIQVEMEQHISRPPAAFPGDKDEEAGMSALWSEVERLRREEEALKQEVQQLKRPNPRAKCRKQHCAPINRKSDHKRRPTYNQREQTKRQVT